MFNKLLFFAIGTLFIFTSCEKKATSVAFTTDIKDINISQVTLANLVEGIYDTLLLGTEEPFQVNIGSDATLLEVKAGRSFANLFVAPGDIINIGLQGGSEEFVITSSHQAEQQLLQAVDKEKSIVGNKYGPYKIMKLELDEFHAQLEEKYAGTRSLIENARGKVDANLIEWLEGSVKAGEVQAKTMYPQYYNYLNKTTLSLAGDYYDFVEDFDFEDEELFFLNDVRTAGEAIIGYNFNYEDMESISAYYAAQYNAIDGFTSSAKLREFYKCKLLKDKISYGGGIDGMEDEIQAFLMIAKNEENIGTINRLVSEWENLKKGLDAPNFTAFTRDGVQVQLSDLKGKNVYIDVWATWCGPCIAEIPSLKEMEAKYHGENVEFLSVSIDKESDKEKWKQFVMDKDLQGSQWMAQYAWKSEIATHYNIKGIPRFILVGKDGKIVSADAPRPSNTENLDGLLAELLQ